MSHSIEYFTYRENTQKAKKQKLVIEQEMNRYAALCGHREGSGGLGRPIRWYEEVCDTYTEATEKLDRAAGRGDQLAVRFRQPKQNAALREAQKKVGAAYPRLNSMDQALHFADAKAELIGCKHCGSKIAHKYLRSNYCPICHQDMRPASKLKQIEQAKAAVKKAEDNLLKVGKANATDNIYWLVRIDYHT